MRQTFKQRQLQHLLAGGQRKSIANLCKCTHACNTMEVQDNNVIQNKNSTRYSLSRCYWRDESFQIYVLETKKYSHCVKVVWFSCMPLLCSAQDARCLSLWTWEQPVTSPPRTVAKVSQMHESGERHLTTSKNKYLGKVVTCCSKLLHLVAYYLL